MASHLTWEMSFLVTPLWVWLKLGVTAPHQGHRRRGERESGADRAGGRGRDGSCPVSAGSAPWKPGQ